ncbi:aldose 1-epimerase family protein [Herbiconiux sp. CPCC 205763]|uniref:Aldose 1-epimerase family protein n=1 Tax=Herbiconiux aconitum TaxID=2970913 RepID=A0ABT2GNP4_9MICO|nr:aldose 1-epimerase family protein [Herbiconiux aconitum]MCS5717853.1 aldose 1-epimerase family protein [Herbiconiux aconitum]
MEGEHPLLKENPPVAAVRPLSGARIDLEAGDYRASIASIGATLRVLQHRTRNLVVPFEVDEQRPAYRGVTLAPWPNRVVDGRYTFAGVEEQLALTEPARSHALHGLVSWLDFGMVDRTPESVSLVAAIEAQTGYPHRLELRVDYRLDEEGLHQTVTARNPGAEPAPFGTGPHPYLVAGPGHVDDWTLSLPAEEVLTVTPERLIPIGLSQVAVEDGGVFDFREARTIGDTFIDHAFTNLHRNGGTAVVAVTAPDGTGVAMSFGPECEWVQIHTADTPVPETSRIGLAVEPMTCPPDAFNSGHDLIVIAPEESASASWTISAIG